MRLFAILILAAAASWSADANRLTIASAFTLSCPDGWTSAAIGEVTTLTTPKHAPHIQIWPLAGKRNVDEAAADITSLVVDQVKDFVVAERKDVQVAGAKALLLVGTGAEADDGDPSNAQVTLFTFGSRVWLLISHGEGSGATERAADLKAALATIAATTRP